MSVTIQTYSNEEEAVGARDQYNQGMEGYRAIVFKMPGTSIEDFGGGDGSNAFKDPIAPEMWLLVVDNLNA